MRVRVFVFGAVTIVIIINAWDIDECENMCLHFLPLFAYNFWALLLFGICYHVFSCVTLFAVDPLQQSTSPKIVRHVQIAIYNIKLETFVKYVFFRPMTTTPPTIR